MRNLGKISSLTIWPEDPGWENEGWKREGCCPRPSLGLDPTLTAQIPNSAFSPVKTFAHFSSQGTSLEEREKRNTGS